MSGSHDACLQVTRRNELLALSTEQGLLLWCMRMWVTGLKRGMVDEARIEDALATIGVQSASGALKNFLLALSQGCVRMINVQCTCRQQLGPDEHALLEVLALAQALRRFEAVLVLRDLVTQAGAEEALEHAEAIGTALAEAGRFLPEPTRQGHRSGRLDHIEIIFDAAPTLH